MSADERAQLLSGLGEGEVPSFLLDEKGDFRKEVEIWKELSTDLRRINALARLDRFGFAMYCVHMADWIRATLHIKEHGATYKARNTINKDVLHKINPMVRVREIAERHILELGARFGLDPMNRFRLIGVQSGLAGQGFLPGLTPPDDKPKPQVDKQEESGAATGALARAATPLPGQLPN